MIMVLDINDDLINVRISVNNGERVIGEKSVLERQMDCMSAQMDDQFHYHMTLHTLHAEECHLQSFTCDYCVLFLSKVNMSSIYVNA